MKKAIFAIGIFLTTVCVSLAAGAATSFAQLSGNSAFDAMVLLPGDSRSLDFEFNDTVGSPESLHAALITAICHCTFYDEWYSSINLRSSCGGAIKLCSYLFS